MIENIGRQHGDFCLRPSAKDQGNTRVVVVVLFHLSHFLIKRKLSEKNIKCSLADYFNFDYIKASLLRTAN